MRSPRLLLALLAAAALTLAACGDSDDDSTNQKAATTPAALSCAKADLDLVTGGQLTVGTDKPAFPPYFENDDPTNGKGFESAVAYAVADQLGFEKNEVKWKVVPFNASFKPGPKDFDFDVNQISINEQRKRAIDFSDPYYTAPQGIIAPKGSAAAGATSLSDLADKTIGVQIGTTSLEAVTEKINPSKQPKVFDDSNAVVTALKQGQVDAVVTDLPTALLHHGRTGPELEARRPVLRAGRRRVGRAPGEGLQAHGVRVAGDRQVEDVGRARADHAEVDGPVGRRA